jgi:hypothetical protein
MKKPWGLCGRRWQTESKGKKLTADLNILKRDFISSVYSFIVMLSIYECVKIFSGDLNERGKVLAFIRSVGPESIGQWRTLHNATGKTIDAVDTRNFCMKSNLTRRFFLLSMASG